LLAVVHIGPLIGTTRALTAEAADANAVLSCAAVWLAFAFFILKFIDIALLRWRMNRSSILAFLLACAVAHQDVQGPWATKVMLAELPAAVAISAVWESLSRSGRSMRRVLWRLLGLRAKPLQLSRAFAAAFEPASWSLSWFHIASAGVPRAPPA